MAAVTACPVCDVESLENARFCQICGSPVDGADTAAEYKQVKDRDGIDLRVRGGLNSGQVIGGEIGRGALGYTTVGEQVGMAQRMESVALPGGVCSLPIARLIEGAAPQGEPQMARIQWAPRVRCRRGGC